MTRRWFCAALTSAALFAVIGCDSGKKDQNPSGPSSSNGASSPTTASTSSPPHVVKAADPNNLKLAFITNNASDFWKIAASGVKKYEKEAGVHVDIKMPQTGVVAEQNRILEDLSSQNYDGISLSVIAPEDQIQEINRAAEKTNVICHDSDASKSNRLVYIGTNNYEAGKVLGQQILKLLPSGGKMAVFVGTFAADNARQRLKGIEDTIAGHNIQIVARKEDHKDPNKARSNVDDVINANPDIALLSGLWSYNGPQIAAAIDSAGKKGQIKAAVFDEESGTLEGIKNGVIAVTVVQKPFMFGYLASKLLHDLAVDGEKALADPKIKDGVLDTGVEVITSDNVNDFQTRLTEMRK